MVVPRAVAVLTINIKSRLTAVGDERGIGRGDVVVAAAVADRRDRVADFGAVTVRILGDDVDRAADGRGAEDAEPPPRITSTRSIMLAGICSSP